MWYFQSWVAFGWWTLCDIRVILQVNVTFSWELVHFNSPLNVLHTMLHTTSKHALKTYRPWKMLYAKQPTPDKSHVEWGDKSIAVSFWGQVTQFIGCEYLKNWNLIFCKCFLLQGAVYGSQSSVLDSDLFREVVDYKVAEHSQRRMLTGKGEADSSQ